MAKKKLKPLGKLSDECATLLQKLVRLKAADDNGYCQCVSCGVTKHWKEMQGGHFIPRGNKATKLLEENVHPQDAGCNMYGMRYGDAEKQYTLWMVDMYGREFVDDLIRSKGTVHKWLRCDLEELKVSFTKQIKEVMEEKGL